MHRHKGQRRGFSLIDVLIAAFLVAMCSLIVAATLPISNKSRAKADLINKAMGLAQKQIEAIRGLGYANATIAQLQTYGLIDSTTPVATNTYSFSNSDSANLDNPAKVLPSGTATVMLEQPGIDLRRVTVVVNWQEVGKQRTVSLATLIANL